MPIREIKPNVIGAGKKVGIVLSRFNSPVGERLLKGAKSALREAGVTDASVLLVTVPGALEAPLALQYLAQSGRFSALVALGAVIRGETYHFEIVANESASGVSGADQKGREATLAALEMANLQSAIADHEK